MTIEQKQIERLYQLFYKAREEKDDDTASALKWAIFQLERICGTEDI